MKTKKLHITLFIAILGIAILSTFFGFLILNESGYKARAEELSTEETNENQGEIPTIIIENKEEETISEVFKNDILPFVVSAGTSVVAFLIALAPYFKTKSKFNSLQGLYTASKSTNDKLNAQLAEFNTDNFVNSLKTTVIKNLESFIKDTITEVVSKNKIDNTKSINDVVVKVEQMSAQITNLISAAKITWREVDGVSGILAKSPTADVLKDYYQKFVELNKKFEELKGKEIEELTKTVNELSIYGEGTNENE